MLRLVARADQKRQGWGALTLAPGDYVPVRAVAQEQFLDPETHLVRVATADGFVGRRRILQRCLRSLRGRQGIGVFLYGLGGVGKSTLAARLLERLQPQGYDPVVIYRGVDEQQLLRRLWDHQSEMGKEILQGSLPLEQRIRQLLERGLESDQKRLCFVLDDFEANLELRADGQPVLKPEVVDPLMALLKGIKQSKRPHRVIITSRYNVQLPYLDQDLQREELAALKGADLGKKYERLGSFQSGSLVDQQLQTKAKQAADGNPRLLEWLDRILLDGKLNTDQILQKMIEAEDEFREQILAEQLLKQQQEGVRILLSRGLVFHLLQPPRYLGRRIGLWLS